MPDLLFSSGIGLRTQYFFMPLFLVLKCNIALRLAGAALPCAFAAVTLRAVATAAGDVVQECQKQLPGILDGTNDPDYQKCVEVQQNMYFYTQI